MTRKTWALAAAAVLAVASAIGGVIVLSSPKQAAAAAPHASASTATIDERELSATVSETGILTYRARPDGSPYSVINQAPGTYTVLPGLGRVITQGHVLYRVNNRPVTLLQGSTPAYRTLSRRATGPDVAELNRDLVALGYATRAQLSRSSDAFGAATTRAVRKLQAALGVTQTGALGLGQALFEPTAVRVMSVPAQLGGRTQPGQRVILATSTARQVQVALDASQQTEVAVGNRVTITLPNGQTTPGVVSSVGTVATCSSSSSAGGSSPSSSSPATAPCPSGGSGSSTATISVVVTPSDPAAIGPWDQAPVQVGITTAKVPNALVVPVSALLAQSRGGYAVEVVGGGESKHLVPVSLGMFDDADGLVQVRGSGLAAGQKVVVPLT